MNKMKKLLSVLLAVIIALSCMTVMASAAATNYKTVTDLNTLKAYSPYGQVTRLDTEARISMLFDFLDTVLLPKANIYMPDIVNIKFIAHLTVDLRSVNGLCATITEAKKEFNGLKRLAGDLANLKLDTWPDTAPTRESYAQKDIVKELVELIAANADLVYNILNKGSINLGSIVGRFVDVSSINETLSDLPGLIKGMIFGLFERWDDTVAEITTLEGNKTGDGKFESTLNTYVNNLFTNDMSIVTVKADSAGNIKPETTLPGSEADGKRCYYVKSTVGADTVLTTYTYATAKIAKSRSEAGLPTNPGEYFISAKYLLKEEVYGETATGDYVFAQVEIDEKDQIKYDKDNVPKYTGENLKYYKNNSPFLPSLKADLDAGKVTINLNTDSAASLLYKFIPYVFDDLAVVPANGSLKKILASWFGARFEYVGEVGSDAVNALPDSSNAFFAQKEYSYVWGWSDYAVINDTHYYRFKDEIHRADLSNINPYFKIINWNYNIAKGFMNDFVPAADAISESNTVLKNLNAFVIKVANEVLVSSVTFMDGDTQKTFTRPTLAATGNDSLVENIKVLARKILAVSPASIFGSNYENGYYSLIANGSNDDILTGIACMIVDLVMPQMTLPSAAELSGVKVGAILAAVVRELATQLLPSHNYDALIYSDYTTKTFLSGKDNSYWLDVLLTMGTDIGIHYLRNLADMGENDAAAWAGMTAAGYKENKTYAAADLDEIVINENNETVRVKPWEAKVDYIIDWALQSNKLWAWKFEKLINIDTLTIDMATVQDPWTKLDKIFFDLLPLEDVFNLAGKPADKTRLEYILRDRFILALVDLDWQQIVGGPAVTGLLQIPAASVLRQADVLTQAVIVIRDLLNGILNKVAGGALLDTTVFVGLDELFTKANIATLAKSLVSKLLPAYNNGLLDPVLPIVGFFLGWHTNPQTLADPVLSFTLTDGYEYLVSSGGQASTTLTITNQSAGMLYKYRNGTEDKPHNIKITSITTDTDGITLSLNKNVSSSSPLTIAPYGKDEVVLTINGSLDKTICDVIVKYQVIGKNDQPIGGEQEVKTRFFISNETDNIPTWPDDPVVKKIVIFPPSEKTILTRTTIAQGIIVDNLAEVEDFAINYKSDADNGLWITAFETDYAGETNSPIFGYIAPETVVHGNNKTPNNTLKAQHAGFIGGKKETDGYNYLEYELRPYTLKDKNYQAKSGETFQLGEINVSWRNKDNNGGTTIGPFTVYYRNTEDLAKLYNSVKGIFKSDINFGISGADTAWNNFRNALIDAAYLIQGPKNLDTFPTNYSETNVKAKYDALKNAVEALDNYKLAGASGGVASASSIRDEFKTALDTNEGEIGINFQDYDLYEYFKYHDVRQIVYNRMDEYKGPEAPTNTLWTVSGSSVTGEDYTNAVSQISKKGEKYALAIENAAYKPSQDDINNYNIAVAQWKAPEYSELDNDNIMQLLGHYKSVLRAKSKVEKQFLDKEITAAAANYGTDATNAAYSTKTWADYKSAYDKAVEINAKTTALQSEVFQAKWDLMVAEKNLIEKNKSVLDNAETYLKDFNKAVALADAIFADPTTYPVKAGVAAAANFDGSDEAYAYSQLLKARGVTYTNTEGDNIVLFSDSAEEYLTWDRENTTNNINRINTATNNLNAAIALFDVPVASAPEFVAKDDKGNVTTGAFGEVTTDESGVARGYIYGVKAGTSAEACFRLEDPSAGTVEWTASAGGSKNGTGAVATVKDKSGKTVAEYTLIIFGDVDGDGSISNGDFVDVKRAAAGVKLSNDVYTFAADVDGVGGITNGDFVDVKRAAAGVPITSNPYAG